MGSMGTPCALAMRRFDDRLRMHSSAVRRVDGSICARCSGDIEAGTRQTMDDIVAMMQHICVVASLQIPPQETCGVQRMLAAINLSLHMNQLALLAFRETNEPVGLHQTQFQTEVCNVDARKRD